jgi:hypothetical protein
MFRQSALRRALLGFARRVAAARRADTSNLQACREAAGTLARSCVMLSSPSRKATLESVLLLVSCTLILLGIVSAFFLTLVALPPVAIRRPAYRVHTHDFEQAYRAPRIVRIPA